MKAIEIIRLTPTQEIEVLESLGHAEPIGSGSSRAVYDLDAYLKDSLFDELGILTEDRRTTNYVVKLALGLGGCTQMMNEVSAYQNYGLSYPLAEIAAVGHFIIIMEKVVDDDVTKCLYGIDSECPAADEIEREVIINYHENGMDWDFMCDNDLETLEENCGLTQSQVADLQSECEDAANAVSDLDYIFGTTLDNLQIGKSTRGGYVSYDYGFRGDGWGSTNTWSSRLGNYTEDSAVMESYMDKLIGALEAEDEAYASIEAIEADVIDENEL